MSHAPSSLLPSIQLLLSEFRDLDHTKTLLRVYGYCELNYEYDIQQQILSPDEDSAQQ
ncbi:hypothetical protein D3C72_2061700 [compost metagenome]